MSQTNDKKSGKLYIIPIIVGILLFFGGCIEPAKPIIVAIGLFIFVYGIVLKVENQPLKKSHNRN